MKVHDRFFRRDRRRSICTAFGELVLCSLAVGYGMQAIVGGWSQFQIMLALHNKDMPWGATLVIAGTIGFMSALRSVVGSPSRDVGLRLGVHLVLVCVWSAVAVLFLNSKEPEVPLWNAAVFTVFSMAVIYAIAHHEATFAPHPSHAHI